MADTANEDLQNETKYPAWLNGCIVDFRDIVDRYAS
jgi:hypothetical protein